jgi:hypothetical protein
MRLHKHYVYNVLETTRKIARKHQLPMEEIVVLGQKEELDSYRKMGIFEIHEALSDLFEELHKLMSTERRKHPGDLDLILFVHNTIISNTQIVQQWTREIINNMYDN